MADPAIHLARAAHARLRPYAAGEQWGALSSVLTRMSARFTHEVLCRVFPGAVPGRVAPGMFDSRSRLVFLDGELLESDPADWKAPLSGEQSASVIVLLGVLMHELGHAQHTQLESLKDLLEPLPDSERRVLLEDCKLLEEPRMEAHLAARTQVARGLVRAAARRILLCDLPETLDREGAFHTGVLILGRQQATTLLLGDTRRVRDLIGAAIGAGDLAGLEDLLARVVGIADGDADALCDAAREYRDLIGAPPPSPSMPQAGTTGSGIGCEDSQGAAGEADVLDQIREAMSATEADAIAAVDADQVAGALVGELAAAVSASLNGAGVLSGPGGLLAGPASGHVLPPAGERVPLAFEQSARRRLAAQLRRARTRRVGREGWVAPPGRFSGRGAMAASAQAHMGRSVTAQPFRRRAVTTGPLWAPRCVMCADNSGSMSSHAAALGPVIWVTYNAIADLGGQMAVTVFGDAVQPLVDAGQRLTRVPHFRCGGGTEHIDAALALGEEQVALRDPRAPRLVYLLTDGYWDDQAAIDRLAELRKSRVRTLMIGIGSAPSPQENIDETVVIDDPLRMADVIADSCLRALAER